MDLSLRDPKASAESDVFNPSSVPADINSRAQAGTNTIPKPRDVELFSSSGGRLLRSSVTPTKLSHSSPPSSRSLHPAVVDDLDVSGTIDRPVVPRSSSSIARSRTMPRMRTSSMDRDCSPASTTSEQSKLGPAPSYRRLPQETVAGMQRWVHEIVVCNFDLDRGPVVEHRMAGRAWGKGEKENVSVLEIICCD
jgi:hypothetical protein